MCGDCATLAMRLRTAVAVPSRLDKGGLPTVDNIDHAPVGRARTGSRITTQLLTTPQ